MKSLMIKIKKMSAEICRTISQNKIWVFMISVIALSLWANNALAVDPTSDILSTAKGDITSNFGQSSTVMYGVYIAEIFAGVAAYIKSKNLFALLGLVVVVIFTSVGFSLIGS